MQIYDLTEGLSPLIISVPHSGTFVPNDIKSDLTDNALALADTDWHVDQLYKDFIARTNATIIKANYSRYVIDLNRPPDNSTLYPGKTKFSLCPVKTFNGEDIYQKGTEPGEHEIAKRLQKYWRPYHNELEKQITRIKEKHGYAILYDAHSIKQNLPHLFEGDLPDINIGTVNSASCAKAIEESAFKTAKESSYSSILNGRFIGGYITRNYGQPFNNSHAIQMELVRTNYMDENGFAYNAERAEKLKSVLESILNAITHNAAAGIKPDPVR